MIADAAIVFHLGCIWVAPGLQALAYTTLVFVLPCAAGRIAEAIVDVIAREGGVMSMEVGTFSPCVVSL